MEYVTRTKKGKGFKMGKSSWEGNKAIICALARNGKDQVLTRQPRMKSTIDGVVGNDDVDGGTGFDHRSSDPDPVVNC
jgi:hypothetical protein